MAVVTLTDRNNLVGLFKRVLKQIFLYIHLQEGLFNKRTDAANETRSAAAATISRLEAARHFLSSLNTQADN